MGKKRPRYFAPSVLPHYDLLQQMRSSPVHEMRHRHIPTKAVATKHVSRVSPYSPASIDHGFVEIGFAQLSQSVKTTNVTQTLTQTDRQTN